MPETASSSPASDAALALLRAAVDEIKAMAHDPATVHVIADKLKHGIDVLEKALTEEPKQTQKKLSRRNESAGERIIDISLVEINVNLVSPLASAEI